MTRAMRASFAGFVFPDRETPEGPARRADFAPEEVLALASRFRVDGPRGGAAFPKRGNINLHTFVVEGEREGRTEAFLLQRINTDVFSRPFRVMRAMVAWTEAQAAYLEEHLAAKATGWEPIELVASNDGAPFVVDDGPHGWSVWRMMKRIPDVVEYKSLGEVADPGERPRLAGEVGRGLALNADLTSRMSLDGLQPSLLGYRDTRGYFAQFRAVATGCVTREDAAPFLPADPEVAEATEGLYRLSDPACAARIKEPALQAYLERIAAAETFGCWLQDAVASGTVRRTPIHGDTKIENFLFDRITGRVRSLVDLDTIMPFTWLADYGDMLRSLCNVAGEKETDLARVQVDRDVADAVRRGFEEAVVEAPANELAGMEDAVRAIALELGVRFLTDYLRGDNYFRLLPTDPPDLNRQRGLVQLTLFERLGGLERC